MFKATSGTMSIMAFACSVIAARRAFEAAAVPTSPEWVRPGLPGSCEPGDSEVQQMARTGVMLVALERSGSLSQAAVRWTIRAVLLGTTSSIIGLFPL